LTGAAVGGLAGVGIGATAALNNKGDFIMGDGAIVTLFTAAGAVLGSVLGLALGVSKQKKELIYRSPNH